MCRAKSRWVPCHQITSAMGSGHLPIKELFFSASVHKHVQLTLPGHLEANNVLNVLLYQFSTSVPLPRWRGFDKFTQGQIMRHDAKQSSAPRCLRRFLNQTPPSQDSESSFVFSENTTTLLDQRRLPRRNLTGK